MKDSAFLRGLRDGAPISLGYFAVAISLGIAARGAGLTAFQAALASLLNNASAGEFAAFTLIEAGAGYFEVGLMTLVANARYLLMSCALSQKLDAATPLAPRLAIGFDVTDEIFGAYVAQPGALNPRYAYGVILIALPGWAAGTYLGRGDGQRAAGPARQRAERVAVRDVPRRHRSAGAQEPRAGGADRAFDGAERAARVRARVRVSVDRRARDSADGGAFGAGGVALPRRRGGAAVSGNPYAYILVMAAVSYLIRALPLTLIRRRIENRFVRSFLYYVPYVTLAVMTFPAILSATGSVWSAWLGLAAALACAWRGMGLLPVACAACAAVVPVGIVPSLRPAQKPLRIYPTRILAFGAKTRYNKEYIGKE